MSKLKIKIKQLFCMHDYNDISHQRDEFGFIIKHLIGNVLMCNKCGKTKITKDKT